MLNGPSFIFVPVSSVEGIGEYMRSLIIATEVKQRWPNAVIHFILNKNTPYAKNCPFEAFLLDDTPTKCVKEVNDIMSELTPDIVIFDASGRQSQLKHASNIGTKVIFISQHKRKRSRGLKLSRARYTNCHWVVQPDFILGSISWLEKLKLQFLKKPTPVAVGPVFSKPDKNHLPVLLDEYGLVAGEYLIFNAGSGGHLAGKELAADIFAEVAVKIHAERGVPCIMIFGSNYPKALPRLEGVKVVGNMDNLTFINLLSASQAAVISGGDTLLQAVSLHVPVLAVPVSKDQPARIKVCQENGLIMASATNVESMLRQLPSLLDPVVKERIILAMQEKGCSNGLDKCLADIKELLF
jgi:ADP-heptose:LPS heptosyltransferase